MRSARAAHWCSGIIAGGAGTACIMNTAGFWRTMEQVFIDLLTDSGTTIRAAQCTVA